MTVEDRAGRARRSTARSWSARCRRPRRATSSSNRRCRSRSSDAISRLRYGCATRLLLQFDRRFWKKRGRPLAFGTDLPTGAVWDGNEQQRGRGILSFLAGGRASSELQQSCAPKASRRGGRSNGSADRRRLLASRA